jgi:hypothetical protein
MTYMVFQKELYNSECSQIYSEGMYGVLYCHNVARHAEFYLG